MLKNKIIKKELDDVVEENATLKKQNNDLKESLEKYKDLVDEIRCYKILKKMNKK